MSFSIGIVGLPNVGKSTLFKALTRQPALIANYPFATIDPNLGIVAVPDERLQKLAEVSKSAKIVPTTIEFVDIAGLVKGAAQGEGLGNKFLSHIREVSAIAQVVREFSDLNIIHVAGAVNPKNDFEIINTELALADWEQATRHLREIKNKARAGINKTLEKEILLFEKIVKDRRTANAIGVIIPENYGALVFFHGLQYPLGRLIHIQHQKRVVKIFRVIGTEKFIFFLNGFYPAGK